MEAKYSETNGITQFAKQRNRLSSWHLIIIYVRPIYL